MKPPFLVLALIAFSTSIWASSPLDNHVTMVYKKDSLLLSTPATGRIHAMITVAPSSSQFIIGKVLGPITKLSNGGYTCRVRLKIKGAIITGRFTHEIITESTYNLEAVETFVGHCSDRSVLRSHTKRFRFFGHFDFSA